MEENLSHRVADLFDKSKGGEALSTKMERLRSEITKVMESENTIFGKFRELLESFREIIPDEKQRYTAAIKALSTTSKLSRQEIVKAVINQLEELKILEKVLMPAIPGWRDDLIAAEAKSKEIRAEITKLRERIALLEIEEKAVLNVMSSRGQEMELIEKTVRGVFTDIGTEITHIKTKVEEFTADTAAAQPVPQQKPVEIEIFVPVEKKGVDEQKSEIIEPSAPETPEAPPETERHKNCPMCGMRMTYLSYEKKWRCHTCAYEELKKEEVQLKNDIFDFPPPAPQPDTEWHKKCPMCGGRMNFHSNDNMWQCYACAHEEEEGGDQDKSNANVPANTPEPTPASKPLDEPFPSLAVPEAAMPVNDHHESRKGLSRPKSMPSSKKKTCPVCRKKMDWYELEKTWRCPFCDYMRTV